jgi:predicted nucleic acid-binding protein
MSKIVIDASIVLACLFNEPEKQLLEELTSGADLVAPGSLPWEVGNAVSASFKKKKFFDLKSAHTVIKEFIEIPIQLVHVDLKNAIDICFKRGIYAYDAYMILCARQTRAPLLTLDKRLASVAAEENIKVLEV